jgi:hypothetical protein
MKRLRTSPGLSRRSPNHCVLASIDCQYSGQFESQEKLSLHFTLLPVMTIGGIFLITAIYLKY